MKPFLRNGDLRDIAPVRKLEEIVHGYCQGSESSYASFLKSGGGFLLALHRTHHHDRIVDALVGYLGFKVHPRCQRTHLLDVAVHPDFRRHHVASLLLSSLKDSATKQRHSLTAKIHERLVPAQMLLRSQGFRCITTVPRAYPSGDDAFIFLWPDGNFPEGEGDNPRKNP